MQSRQQLIDRALKELGIVAAGQSASAEDVAVIEAEIDPIMQDLSTRNIWQWGDPDEFDDNAVIHLAKILANSVARVFGMEPDESKRQYCEMRLRLLSPVEMSGQPQKSVYY